MGRSVFEISERFPIEYMWMVDLKVKESDSSRYGADEVLGISVFGADEMLGVVQGLKGKTLFVQFKVRKYTGPSPSVPQLAHLFVISVSFSFVLTL